MLSQVLAHLRCAPVALCAVAVLAAGCSTKGAPDAVATVDFPESEAATPENRWETREEALTDIFVQMDTGVVEPALARFVDEARLLDDRVQEWSDLRDEPSHLAAQEQWRTTMMAWQYLESAQIGPVAPAYYTRAGLGLRDEVYSWPSSNLCLVDQTAAYQSWSSPDFFEDYLPNVYGLDALEYLLFVDTTDNACPDAVDINATGTWVELGEDGVERARAQLAAVLSAGLVEVGSELHTSWRNDYAPMLATAQGSQGPIPSAQGSEQADVLNEVRLAWAYVDMFVQNRKLCAPLGMSDCTGADYLDEGEHTLSGMGLAAIHQNLVAFQDMFTGRDGPGFDDLLVMEGHGELAASFKVELSEAIEAAAALSEVETIDPDDVRLHALHQEVVDISLMLEADLSDALCMELHLHICDCE